MKKETVDRLTKDSKILRDLGFPMEADLLLEVVRTTSITAVDTTLPPNVRDLLRKIAAKLEAVGSGVYSENSYEKRIS